MTCYCRLDLKPSRFHTLATVLRRMQRKLTRQLPAAMAAGSALWLAAPAAQASFLSGDALDTMADIIAVVVLIFVPVVVLGLFWMVHILPEKVAEKRQHPQKDAIKTLCILSLFFGGMLWPLAWLWAYSKPVMYKLAYGTDKHEDADADAPEAAGAVQQEATKLREDVETLAANGGDAATLNAIRRRLAALEARLPPGRSEGAAG